MAVIPVQEKDFKGALDKAAQLYFFGVTIESLVYPDRYAIITASELDEEERAKYPTVEEHLGRITQDAQRHATLKYFVNGPEDIKAVSLTSLTQLMSMNFQYSALLYDSKYIHPNR